MLVSTCFLVPENDFIDQVTEHSEVIMCVGVRACVLVWGGGLRGCGCVHVCGMARLGIEAVTFPS